MTEKQKYFEYEPSSGSKWWVKDTPTAEAWFQQGLNRFAGFSDRGQPKLRLVWGAAQLSDITEKPQLKYKAVSEIITGYNYLKEDGTIGTTPSMNLPNDAAMPWQFHPKSERLELGRLRWAIEKHVPAHELVKLGRFQNLRAPDGEKILRDLPPEGVYDHYFWIQTRDKRYRDPDNQVLTAIESMWTYDLTTSETQKALDNIEFQDNQILIGANEARAVWSQL